MEVGGRQQGVGETGSTLTHEAFAGAGRLEPC